LNLRFATIAVGKIVKKIKEKGGGMKSIRLKIIAIIFIAVRDLLAPVAEMSSPVGAQPQFSMPKPHSPKALAKPIVAAQGFFQDNSYFKPKTNPLKPNYSSSLRKEQKGIEEFNYGTGFKPESQEQGQFQEVPLMENPLHLKAQTSTKAQEIQAETFYARMGTSLQAFVDALSRINSATWQKIMDYLYGSRRLRQVSNDLDGDIELISMSTVGSFDQGSDSIGLNSKSVVSLEQITKAPSPLKLATEIAQLTSAEARSVLQIVAQAPEVQAGSGKPFVAPDQQIFVEGKSGSITMPVQKFAVLDPIVQAGSGKPFVAPDRKILLDAKTQVGGEALPVEIVQPIDLQQQSTSDNLLQKKDVQDLDALTSRFQLLSKQIDSNKTSHESRITGIGSKKYEDEIPAATKPVAYESEMPSLLLTEDMFEVVEPTKVSKRSRVQPNSNLISEDMFEPVVPDPSV
jgi:hypothetical protein